MDSQQKLAALVSMLADDDADFAAVRDLVDELGAGRDASLVPELYRVLAGFLDRGDWFGRDQIAEVLYGLQGIEALPLLLRAAARDLGDDQQGIGALIIDLLYVDHARARAAVLEALAGGDPALRRIAVWALGFVRERQDAEALLQAAADPDPAIRAAAVGSSDARAGRDSPELAVLRGALADADPRVRISALIQLGHRGAAALAPAVAAIAGDPDRLVRAAVAEALGLSAGPGARDTLDRLAGDPDEHVRGAAIRALRRLDAIEDC
ncbi:MAG TPA: HEAT repeat domain-containing protein [Actinocrinis sp.]|jgi:HEAT repeat protein